MDTTSIPKSDSAASHSHNRNQITHSVQFYWDDTRLLDKLGQKIGEALTTGGAAIVIGTNGHRTSLAERLRERPDFSVAAQEGRYLALDAAETLANFMVNGWPDEVLFQDVVGAAVSQVSMVVVSENSQVVAFGEMVALLLEQGLPQAALRLEQLWNDLVQKQSLALLCAYPMHAFETADDSKLFRRVCEEHSSVIPASDHAEPFNEENYRRNTALLEQTSQALETERALRQSEQRFQLLVESVQDYAIFMLDCEGHVGSWNEGARRIKGYSASDIMGRHFSCFYPEEDIRAGKPQMELRVASQYGRFEDEGWRLRKDGSRFWANVIITALKDASGQLCGFSKVTRDTTDRMRAQETLRQSRDALKKEVEERLAAEARLQESEASLRALSRNLFHIQDEERKHLGRELHDSIGQYLSALKMELDALQFDPILQEKSIRQKLEGSIDIVQQCIKEIRTMSYLLYPPLLEEMGLKMAVPWYLDGFTKRSGIKTRLQMSREFSRLPRNVELVLFRVLQEGLTNVHRHSGSPTALIFIFVESDAVVLEVTDMGRGVPTSVLEFGEKGIYNAGIGLRGMNERLREVGGKLELSSSGKGTTVRASIPCASPDARSGENGSLVRDWTRAFK